jgi:hypothetical protein
MTYFPAERTRGQPATKSMPNERMHGWPATKSSAVREGEQQQMHHQSATILLLGCLIGQRRPAAFIQTFFNTTSSWLQQHSRIKYSA